MGDFERDSVRAERAIDECQCCRVGAIGAVDAPDCCAANREFVGVGLAAVCSPAAAIIIGILSFGRACERKYGD